MIDITEILNLLIRLVFSALGLCLTWAVKTYLIPWIKSKFNAEQVETVKSYIFTLIRSAEQLEANGFFKDVECSTQEAKKAYVLEAVKNRIAKWGFTFDEEEISDLIEGLLKEAKKDLLSAEN
jgi:hypothetical protein